MRERGARSLDDTLSVSLSNSTLIRQVVNCFKLLGLLLAASAVRLLHSVDCSVIAATLAAMTTTRRDGVSKKAAAADQQHCLLIKCNIQKFL